MQNYWKVIPLWIIKICAFIVPFVPLYIAQGMFFPFITGKAFLFRFLAELMFFLWIYLVIFYKEFRPKLSPLLIAVFVFIAIISLATIFGVNPYRSFWSNFERMEGLISYLHSFAFFLVIAHSFKKTDWTIYLNAFIFSGIIQSIYAFFQSIGKIQSFQGGFRVDGTLGNATYVAAYLCFIICFSLLLLVYSKNKFAKIYYSLVIAMSLLTIYFSATRGAALALFIGLLIGTSLYFLLIKSKNEKEKLLKKIFGSVAIILILGASSIYLAKDSNFVKSNQVLSRFASINLEAGKSRFLIWKMGFQGVKERPILGWGPGNFEAVFGKYYDAKMYAQEPWFDRSHNIILDWLINAGVLGLFSYLSIFGVAIYMLIKNYGTMSLGKKSEQDIIENTDREKKLAIILISFFFVYLIQNLFVFDQLATYIGYMSILAYIQSHSKKEEVSSPSSVQDMAFYGSLFLIICLVVSGVTFYFLNVPAIKANKKLLEALSYAGIVGNDSYDNKTKHDILATAFSRLKESIQEKTLGTTEAREQLAQFTMNSVGPSTYLSNEEKVEVYNVAIAEMDKNVTENILNPRQYLFLGILYSTGGLFDASLDTLQKARSISPKKHQIISAIAEVYLKKGDVESAIKYLKENFNNSPDFDSARLNLASIYIFSGKAMEGEKLLIDRYGTLEIPEKTLLSAYGIAKNYARLVGVLKALVALSPKDVSYRKDLSDNYLKIGKYNEAIKILEEGIALVDDQGSKDELSAKIKSIRGF
ncbi:MAG: hypothetical protein EXS49_00775 [Candidatus Pacebacteria bacterium]|nr:hypothetical protein [Candidatus Paceibacterota bacterium]